MASMRGVSVPLGYGQGFLRRNNPHFSEGAQVFGTGRGGKHSQSSVNRPQRKRRPVEDPAWAATPNIHWNRGRLERAGLRKVRVKVERGVSKLAREVFTGGDGSTFYGRRLVKTEEVKGWKRVTVLERIPAAA